MILKEHHPPPPARRSRHPVILCVDDEPAVLAALRRILREEPYEVVTTDQPQEALELLSRRPVSLLISDQRMPAMSGMELLAASGKKSPATARMMLTAYPDSQLFKQCGEIGVQRLFTKPWSDEELRRTVSELLENREAEHAGWELASIPQSWLVEPAGDLYDIQEFVLRVRCEGATGRSLLDRMTPAFHRRRSRQKGLALILENLMMLEDSVSNFVRQLVCALLTSGLHASIVDRSGFVASFLGPVAGAVPLEAYGPAPRGTRLERIVLAEPVEDVALLLRSLIETAGHTCETVPSVEEAAKRLRADDYDRAVVDVGLYDREKRSACDVIPATPIASPCWILYNQFETVDHLARAGWNVRGSIMKPYRLRELFEALGAP